MKIFSSLSLLTLTLALTTSCGKDSDEPKTSEKENNIVAAAWTFQSGGLDGDKNGTIDIPFSSNEIPACYLDDALTFKRDKTGITDGGAIRCSQNSPQQSPFNWGFTDNETSLSINNNVNTALNGKFKIVSLTSTGFTLSKDTVIFMQPAAIVISLKH